MTAVEWLADKIDDIIPDGLRERVEHLKNEAKELENQNIIDILDWLTNEKSEFSIMYGNQEKRFASNDKDFTIKEILEIYKNRL